MKLNCYQQNHVRLAAHYSLITLSNVSQYLPCAFKNVSSLFIIVTDKLQ